MKRQLFSDPLGDAQNIAGNTEQIAHEVSRVAASVKVIARETRVIYEALVPLVKWVASRQSLPSAGV